MRGRDGRRIPPEYFTRQAVGGIIPGRSARAARWPVGEHPRPERSNRAPEHLEVLPTVRISFDRRELAGQPQQLPHPRGVVDDVAAKHLGASGGPERAAWPAPGRGSSSPHRSVQQPKDRGLSSTSRSTPASAVVVRKRLTTPLDIDGRIRHHSLSERMSQGKRMLICGDQPRRPSGRREPATGRISDRASPLAQGAGVAGRPTPPRTPRRSPSSSSAVF